MIETFLLEKVQARLASQEYFIANGGRKSYDLCADGGYNEAVKSEIEFLKNLLSDFANPDYPNK